MFAAKKPSCFTIVPGSIILTHHVSWLKHHVSFFIIMTPIFAAEAATRVSLRRSSRSHTSSRSSGHAGCSSTERPLPVLWSGADGSKRNHPAL
jgi:hypothetical protein